MKSDYTNKPKNEQRVELKYCEGCGGLGVRECGGGQVYCDDCARKMAELPVSKTPSRRPTLPVGRRSALGDYAGSRDVDSDELNQDDADSNNLDAMAGPPRRFAAAGGAA
jgi:hypothetical protein